MPVESPPLPHSACIRCGHSLPEGSYWCPECGKLNASPKARLIFALIIVGILAGFGFTKWYVSYLHDLQTSLAQRWFSRGERDLAAKYNGQAIEDFRNALGYEPQNPQYRLRLAEALLAEGPQTKGALTEARAHLLSLWAEEPVNAQVNLDLARLYAKSNGRAQAVRYYRTAIDGIWSDNALEHRSAARLELVNYLLQQKDNSAAAAELIALQAAAPQDPALQLQLGKLLLQVDEPQRAEKAFDLVTKASPENAEAWSGAGQAALALGDYRKAERLLTTAVNLTSAQPGSEDPDRLALVRAVLAIDPGNRSLSLRERASRVAAAFDLTMKRLSDCAAKQGVTLDVAAGTPKRGATTAAAPLQASAAQGSAAVPAPSSLQLLYDSGLQRKSTATQQALVHNPDATNSTMEFVYEAMRSTESSCPPQSPEERALQLLARRNAEEQQ